MDSRKAIAASGACWMLVWGCAVEVPDVGNETPAARNQAALVRDSIGRPLGSISSMIVGQNREAETQMHLVARLEVQENELLEFYELGPGLIMLSGAGRPAVVSDVEAKSRATADYRALWRELAGDAEMPVALDEAIQRMDARLAERRANRPEGQIERARKQPQVSEPQLVENGLVPSEGVGALTAAAPTDWCDSTWWGSTVSGYSPYQFGQCPNVDFEVCWNYVTGSGWASHDDLETLWTNVCPYFGSVTMAVDADEGWISEGQWNVPEDTVRWKKTTDPGCDEFPFTNDCPYIRVDITNAFGDAYHFRYLVKE